ncbi:hemerythrin domain-containing protein [Streptomyces sp. NPDC012888]|uniref:hemerythrin domain-containing protein n=1 Tax=Streptomyces sp. NPDC012888 TaxID=3364855 RepID=UPI00367F2FA8
MSTDAIVMLREDHKQLRKLMRDYRAALAAEAADPAADTDTGTKGDVVDDFLHALTVHSYVETEGVYPRVRDLLPETEPEILRFKEEHHLAGLLSKELVALRADDEAFDAKASVLMDAVERHIAAEEEDWFPRVRAGVGRKELQSIGVLMNDLRERAPQRPHRALLQKLTDAITG